MAKFELPSIAKRTESVLRQYPILRHLDPKVLRKLIKDDLQEMQDRIDTDPFLQELRQKLESGDRAAGWIFRILVLGFRYGWTERGKRIESKDRWGQEEDRLREAWKQSRENAERQRQEQEQEQKRRRRGQDEAIARSIREQVQAEVEEITKGGKS